VPVNEQDLKIKRIDDFEGRLLRVVGGANSSEAVKSLKAYDVVDVRP